MAVLHSDETKRLLSQMVRASVDTFDLGSGRGGGVKTNLKCVAFFVRKIHRLLFR